MIHLTLIMFACLDSSSDSDEDNVPQKKIIKSQKTVKSQKNIATNSCSMNDVNDVNDVNDAQSVKNIKNKKNKKHKKLSSADELQDNNGVGHIADSSTDRTENSSKILNSNKNHKTKKSDNNLVTIFSDNVEILIGGKMLINESNVVINSNTKYFLMGNNGSGKTTLMKYLYEKLKHKDILMIDQDVKIESNDQSIRDFILCAHEELYTAKKQLDELEQIDELSDDQQEIYEQLGKYIYSHNWDKYEAKSHQILNGLGFVDVNKKVSLLSGGWRMRLALGRALLYEPAALFLDESNNHLDLNASIWLCDYLESYPKSIVMITHQVGFINALAEYIWWIGNPECTGPKLYTIKGQYHNLLQFETQTKKEVEQKYKKLQTKIAAVRARKKPLATKDEINKIIKEAAAPRPPKEYSVNIEFEDVNNRLGMRNIVEFRDVKFKYSPESNVILRDVTFSINLQSRYVIVGENGAGKTTLLKLCTQLAQPTEGEIIKDNRINIAHFHQLTVDNLPLNMTSIEYLRSLDSSLNESDCRARLGRIGLKKIDNLDIPKNTIDNLSGGQKARLAFAVIQLSSPEIILLDEPTNNLDITSIEALITAINAFNGGIIIITHDTHLIESIDKCELYEVKNSQLTKLSNDFESYKNKIVS